MLEIGSVLDGKYKILSEIGHGGMSVVYMALNEKANKTWAVKEIRKDGKMDFNTVRQGLVAEIETLKKLKHPNLPSVVDVIEDQDTFIIVMDYIEGNSLDKALKEHGAQPQEYVIEWAKQLCDVLGYLHSCDPPIIYRDMKPANIMLKPDGNIALIDFGTAKTYEIDLGETTGIGTIGYAAPEQYIGSGLGRTDARTDIYCLGITLYHLLTGIDPCETVISDKSIRAVNPSLSPGLDEIIIKCTHQQPDDRYQSCTELLYALEHHNEMGDAHRKKQIKKLTAFASSVAMTVLSAIVAIFGFVMAGNEKTEVYDKDIELAKNPELALEQKMEHYFNAIYTDPTRTEAYENIIDYFISSGEENGALSKAEAAYIAQLKAGLDSNDEMGFGRTVHALDELKTANPDGYQKVCEDFGFAYWYDFEEKSQRYKYGAEWFENVESPLAGIFCEIHDCYVLIEKYRSQERVSREREEYGTLWGKINELYNTAETIDDIDMQIQAWREIVRGISEHADFFVYVTTEKELLAMLDKVSESAGKENGAVDDTVENLLADIETAKSRVGVAQVQKNRGNK